MASSLAHNPAQACDSPRPHSPLHMPSPTEITSSAIGEQPPTAYGAPFDDEDADIIIRSSDLIDFRVFKVCVVKASPIFEQILLSGRAHMGSASLPSHGIRLEQHDEFPVLCLRENNEVLRSLLSIIMPIPSFVPKCLEDVISVMGAAQRYHMTSVLVHIRASYRLETETPFATFFLAWKHRLVPEALVAVRAALDKPLTIEALGQDLRNTTGPALYELVSCRSKSIETVRGALRQLRKTGIVSAWGAHSGIAPQCCRLGTVGGGVPDWLDGFLSVGESDLGSTNEIHFFHALRQHVVDTGCFCCASLSTVQSRRLWAVVNDTVAEAMSQAQYTLTSIVGDPEVPTTSPAQAPEKIIVTHDAPSLSETADIVLRSSDGVDLRAHKTVLAIASPFFRDMFRLPQANLNAEAELVTPGGSAVHVIQMAEDSETISGLLAAIYLHPLPQPTSFSRFAALLAALQKFDMDNISAHVRRSIDDTAKPDLINADNALHSYAIAVQYELAEEALKAARLTLEKPAFDLDMYGDLLRMLPTGNALYEISQYRSRCREAAKQELLALSSSYSNSVWALCHHKTVTFPCSKKSHTIETAGCQSMRALKGMSALRGQAQVPRVPGWLADQVEHILDGLESGSICPSAKTVAPHLSFMSSLRSHVESTECHSCSTAFFMEGGKLWTEFMARYPKVIERVQFNLPWQETPRSDGL